MSIDRRRFLLSSLAAATASSVLCPVAKASSAGPEYLIVVMAKGGWDVTFAMDPKPSSGVVEGPEFSLTDHPSDSEDLATFGAIPVMINDHKRPSVTRFFEEHHDKTCVVNGIWTGSIVHQPCRIRMLTGTRDAGRPDVATIIGADGADARPLGSVDFSGLSYAGGLASTTGRIGARSQLKMLLDPSIHFPAPSWASYDLPTYVQSDASRAATQDLLQARAKRMASQLKARGMGTDAIDQYLDSLNRAESMLQTGGVLADSLIVGELPSPIRQADMAVDLLVSGLCRTITMAHLDSWDTHDLNVLQHDRYETLFRAINRLMENLRIAQLLDKTMVVVTSEMTRTPKHNFKGGKDHWGHTSALLIGAGVTGDRVVGATDDQVQSLPIDLATGEPGGQTLNKYDNFCAGLLHSFDIDPEPWFPTIEPMTAPFTA